MARRRRRLGSSPEDHRARAGDFIKMARQDVKHTRKMLAQGECYRALKSYGSAEFWAGKASAERRGTGQRKKLHGFANTANKLANRVIGCFNNERRSAVEAAKSPRRRK